MDQSHSPESVVDVIPYATCQILIPDKHRVVDGLSGSLVAEILLEATHDMVGVAEEEVFCEIYIAEELLVSTTGEENETIMR